MKIRVAKRRRMVFVIRRRPLCTEGLRDSCRSALELPLEQRAAFCSGCHARLDERMMQVSRLTPKGWRKLMARLLWNGLLASRTNCHCDACERLRSEP